MEIGNEIPIPENQSLVKWEEPISTDDRDCANISPPLFVRDYDEYGEKFKPEICGVSLYRNMRFPFRLPLAERLSFMLHCNRLPIPSTGVDFSILTKNAVLNLNLQNLSKPRDSIKESEFYNITHHGIATGPISRYGDAGLCFKYRLDHLPEIIDKLWQKWRLPKFLEKVDFILVEGLLWMTNAKTNELGIQSKDDENQTVLYFKPIKHKNINYQIVVATITNSDFTNILLDPSIIISKDDGYLIHIEPYRLIAVFLHWKELFLLHKWKTMLISSFFFCIDISRRFHAEYIHNFQRGDNEKSLRICLERGESSNELRYSGNIENVKKLDKVTLSMEFSRKLGVCKPERYGIKFSYLYTTIVSPYAAASISYYGAYGNKEFIIPLYYDFPPQFVFAPEAAAGFVLGPIMAISMYKKVKECLFKRKIEKVVAKDPKKVEVLKRKSALSTVEFEIVKATVNDKSDVTKAMAIITKQSTELCVTNMAILPGFPDEPIEHLTVSYIYDGNEISLKIPNGETVDFKQF